MVKLSIIVPVFNVEKYVEKCIKSILEQEFRDFELILVDDGSSDESGRILDQYRLIDSRIIVIHQKNMGVSSARNTGLNIATGKYIGFIDSDCWIDQQMYKEMLLYQEDKELDILCCNWNEDGKDYNSTIKETLTMESSEFYKRLFDIPRTISDCIWNKVFLRSYIGEIRFNTELAQAEDYQFLIDLYRKDAKMGYIPKVYYYGCYRPGSATNSGTWKRRQALVARKKCLVLLKKKNKDLFHLALSECIDLTIRFKQMMISEQESEEHIRFFDVILRDLFAEYKFDILFNRNIFWKTKIVYFIKFFGVIKGDA